MLVYTLVVFLLKWQFMYKVSDNAMNALLKFLTKFFVAVVKSVKLLEELNSIIEEFPTSLYSLQKLASLDNKLFNVYSSCPKCHAIYSNLETEVCKKVPFPANDKMEKCECDLLKTIKEKGKTVKVPSKLYFYQSLKSSISTYFKREGFVELCQHWRERSRIIPTEWLGDVYDGKIWSELSATGFFMSPYNLALQLNVDWFQPYIRVRDSVGVLYLSIANLPRNLRYLQENVILVGIIPGPKEPKLNINSYLEPLVDELKEFWSGVQITLSSEKNITACICLICVSCDIPAVRKVCGFLGHQARLGCSKCLCEFKHLPSGGLECLGNFGQWKLRTLDDHKNDCEKSLQCKSKTALEKFSSNCGARFSALLDITYFNPVRNHVIDPMHNLLLGTAKHIIHVWAKVGLLSTHSFSTIEKTTSLITCPYDVGRLPVKIGSSFSGFTADQWKLWTTVYSVIVLKGVLPDNHLHIWLLFVRACSILCSRIVQKPDLEIAHTYLKEFSLKFIEAYGHEHFTPNMHLHMHLNNCCQDYGSVYAFWCFAYERYNGILGSYQTNKRRIEAQIMKKFLLHQQVDKLEFPAGFKEFSSILTPFNNIKGSLKMDTANPDTVVKFNALAQSTLDLLQTTYKSIYFSIEKGIDLLPKVYEKVLSSNLVNNMKQLYALLYPDYEFNSFSLFYEESSSATLLGETYNSVNSRTNRNSVYLANWATNPASSNTSKRVCQIQRFLKHTITLLHKDTGDAYKSVHIFCCVSWFKPHIKYNWFGHSAIVCQTNVEEESSVSLIPIQRFISPCAFGYIPVNFDSEFTEIVLVAIPLPSQLCI